MTTTGEITSILQYLKLYRTALTDYISRPKAGAKLSDNRESSLGKKLAKPKVK